MRPCVAVIGAGHWGKNLIRNFHELGALHTVCDIDGMGVTHHPGVAYQEDYRVVLENEDIRGVVIATPAETHFGIARNALLMGKDVFVEKPLALRASDGRELVETAVLMERVMLVGHVVEYHPAIVKLKQLVDADDLGQLQYIYSNRLNLGRVRAEENILWSFAPHDIAIMLLLTGEMPSGVVAHGGEYLSKGVADVTVTGLTFPSGVKGHIFVSWLHPFKEHKLVVVGDRGMAVFDEQATPRLQVYQHRADVTAGVPAVTKGMRVGHMVSGDEPLRLECQDFLRCMCERTVPRVDGRKGLQVLQVLEMCQEALG